MRTPSQAMLSNLQSRFGSANYKSWQSLRKRWYSFVDYPEAGSSQFNFFGSALGQSGLTLEDTNLPKAGTFGQTHFLLKSISFVFKIGAWDLTAYTGLDNTTLASDVLNGFIGEGYADLTINSRPFLSIPKPFLYAPPFDGREMVNSVGIGALTLTEAAPNTLATYRGCPPYATQNRTHHGMYRVDPNILIEAEQSFAVTVSFPSGLVPIIGTGVTDNSTNPLRVGCIMDGVQFRPLQ